MKKIALILVIMLTFMAQFSEALSLEAVMPIVNGWSASEASNGVKVVKDGDNYYVCNGGNLNDCNKKKASTWVKRSGNTRYICSPSNINCDTITNNGEIHQGTDYSYDFNGFYMCDPTSGVCSLLNRNIKINKITGGTSNSNDYYVCQGEQYRCGKDKASYKVSIATNEIYKCSANTYNCNSSNATSTIKRKSISSSSNTSSNSYSNNNTDFSRLVADLQYEMNSINEANSYFNKALDAAYDNSDYITAIKYQEKVVKIYEGVYKSNRDYKDVLANSYGTLGLYYCFNKDYDNSEVYFKKSLSLVNDPDVNENYEDCKNERNPQNLKKESACILYGPNAYLENDNLCYCKDGYTRQKPDRPWEGPS